MDSKEEDAVPSHRRLRSKDTLETVVVELPRLLRTVVSQKPANQPQEGDDIRGIRLDKFPVGQECLPKGFPSQLTPCRTVVV